MFSRKQKVNLEKYCRGFYEQYILNPPIIREVNVQKVYFDTARKSIIEADNTFSKITSEEFISEMLPLHFELFALAWLHQFGDKLAVAQSVFTKNYLNEKKQNDIWEAMEPYNHVIARSPTIGKTTEKAFDRVYFVKVNTTRANLFDQYHKEGFDDKCVARVLNRLFSEDAWKQRIVLGGLVDVFCKRMDISQLKDEAGFRLAAFIQGIYNGAYQALKNMKIKD